MRLPLICLVSTMLVAGAAQAQNPNADQIVKSLTPGGSSGMTRGIRVGPAAGSPGATAVAAGTSAAQPPAAPPPSVSLTVQFANGSADLTPQAVQALSELGRALSTQTLSTFRFRIEGHTDTVGSREYNRMLSDRRAAAVVEYLAGAYHVDPARLQPVGMGVDGLLIATPDQTPEPRNRRVLVVNLGS